MKKTGFALLLFVLIFAGIATAQETTQGEMRTIFGNNEKITHGGYGALLINYSQINDRDAVLVGGRGGWIVNHGITIGIGGYGFANQLNYKNFQVDNKVYDKVFLSGGYGGLLVEPILFPFSPIHVAIPVIIGAGGAAYVNDYYYGNPGNEWEYYTIDSSPFFVLEPGVEIEFNMVKFMRIGLGAYYRYTSGLDLVNTDEHALDGFSTGISLKFGKF